MATVVAVKRDRHNETAPDGEEIWNFRVQFQEKTFTLNEAKYATDGTTSIPDYGEPLELGSPIIVTSKTAKTVAESPFMADVEVKFSVPQGGGSIEPQPPGATEWGFEVRIEGISYTEPATNDSQTDDPIQNSAGDPFDPTPEKEYFDELITCQKRATTFDSAAMSLYRGKLNSAAVTMTIDGTARTFTAKTLKCGNIAADRRFNPDGTGYWTVTIPLIYRADNWKRKIADRGFNYLDGSDLKRILDDNNQEKPNPSDLDGSGGVNPPGADGVVLEFDIDDTILFTSLLLGF